MGARNSKPSPVDLDDAKYLVYGYIKNSTNEYHLFMNIANAIIEVIYSYYQHLKFNYYNKKAFDVSEDGTVIRGNRYLACGAWTAYISSPGNKGFNKGIHYLAIKNMKNDKTECFRNIGILSQRNEMIITDNILSTWDKYDKIIASCYIGRDKWHYNETISLELDCNEWTVTYWKDDDLFKIDHIPPNKSYHFAVNFCECMSWTHFQIVDHKKYCPIFQ